MLEQAIQAVLSHYAVGPVGVQALAPISGGWSGSQVWRMADPGGELFCLRQWPVEHPTIERLRFIHGVLLTVAGDLPIVAVPLRTKDGSTHVQQAGHLWELTKWRPGTADFYERPSAVRLRAAMHALANFHIWASGCGRQFGSAPAVTDRVEKINALQANGWLAIRQSIPTLLNSEIDCRAVRLWNLLQPIEEWKGLAGKLSTIGSLPLEPAIRDVHHDHILFEGDEVSGIIDFGAMRIDTPLTDVARLVGSLVGNDVKSRETALAAYSEVRPLTEEHRRIIGLLDESGLFLSAVNWLTWLYVERRNMGPDEPILRRLNWIIGRLEGRSS